MSKKNLIILVWLFILLVGPITIFLNSNIAVLITSSIPLVNLLQRLSGLVLFSLLFVQIVYGHYMDFFMIHLGAKSLRYHIVEGLTIYSLVLLHPVLYVVFNYLTLGKLVTFFLPNLDINLPLYELYLTYGRIAMVFLSFGVVVAYFRKHPFFRHNWRKFHILNYFAFFFVSLHARGVGSDAYSFPFNWFFWIANCAVGYIVFQRFIWWRVKKFVAAPQEAKTQ